MEQVSLILMTAVVSPILSTPVVIWNVPSLHCYRNNLLKNLSTYKIHDNTNHTFHGDKVAIFYEHFFGRYPYFKQYNESNPINGGSPLTANLTEHLVVAENNITELIPVEDFNGLAVIGFEEWRPLFKYNPGVKEVYKNHSISYVKQIFSNLTDKAMIEAKAEELFNNAAREFVNETLQLGKRLRPKARWGFYGLPYCNYDAGKNDTDYNCSTLFQGFNDNDNSLYTSVHNFGLSYIYNQSAALFPSIYLGFNATSQQRFRYIKAIIKEAIRISRMYKPPLPIYAYSKFEYDPLRKNNSFYDEFDICSAVKQPFDLGVDGLVLWSSSANIKMRCNFIQNYLDSTLGPVVHRVVEQHKKCGLKKCSNNGKCVLKNPDDMKHHTNSCVNFTMDHSDYKCLCDPLFKGDDCSISYAKKAIWSISIDQCNGEGFANLSDFRTHENPGVFHRDNGIIIEHDSTFGPYPFFNESDTFNGDQEEGTNLTEYLVNALDSFKTPIPEKNFNGLAVLEFTKWDPSGTVDYNKSSTSSASHPLLSHLLASSVCGNMTDEGPEREYISAATEFLLNNASRNSVTKALQFGKSLRSKALWGVYGLPVCNYVEGKSKGDYNCSALSQCINNELRYIYNQSDALYPKIYINIDATEKYIIKLIVETARISRMYNPPLPIYAHIILNYLPPTNNLSIYSEKELCSAVRASFDLGVDGLVFRSNNAKKQCTFIKDYVNKQLGPIVRRVTEFHDLCRIKKCNENGKCVLRNRYDMKYFTDSCSNFTTTYDDYICLCDDFYEGDNCLIVSTNRTSAS